MLVGFRVFYVSVCFRQEVSVLEANTVDSRKLEHGLRVIRVRIPLSIPFGVQG